MYLEALYQFFDKGYVDYKVYEEFSTKEITYVTKLKDNAKYEGLEELDIPDDSDPGVIKDEMIKKVNLWSF